MYAIVYKSSLTFNHEPLTINREYILIPKTRYTDWDDNQAHTDMDLALKWFSWLETHTNFDQLILETQIGRDYWIHISCRKNLKANRHEIYRYMRK